MMHISSEHDGSICTVINKPAHSAREGKEESES
jgi:hypothetical protein